jgi:TPR repeat protein
MVNTEALFRIGDAAEGKGDFALARLSFERGAALGDADCLCRLAYLFDVGSGVEMDKAEAMRLYRRAWRRGNATAGNNIAILYRERRSFRAMFRWWKRLARSGDGSALLEMAKCYLTGTGVRQDAQAALRHLSPAIRSQHIFEDDREEAQGLLGSLRPRGI